MTVTLDFSPEEQAALVAQARSEGLSVEDWLRKLARNNVAPPLTAPGRNLSDLLLNSPFSGANLDLERSRDYPRPVDLG